jgi:hypothetical protein
MNVHLRAWFMLLHWKMPMVLVLSCLAISITLHFFVPSCSTLILGISQLSSGVTAILLVRFLMIITWKACKTCGFLVVIFWRGTLAACSSSVFFSRWLLHRKSCSVAGSRRGHQLKTVRSQIIHLLMDACTGSSVLLVAIIYENWHLNELCLYSVSLHDWTWPLFFLHQRLVAMPSEKSILNYFRDKSMNQDIKMLNEWTLGTDLK